MDAGCWLLQCVASWLGWLMAWLWLAGCVYLNVRQESAIVPAAQRFARPGGPCERHSPSPQLSSSLESQLPALPSVRCGFLWNGHAVAAQGSIPGTTGFLVRDRGWSRDDVAKRASGGAVESLPRRRCGTECGKGLKVGSSRVFGRRFKRLTNGGNTGGRRKSEGEHEPNHKNTIYV